MLTIFSVQIIANIPAVFFFHFPLKSSPNFSRVVYEVRYAI